MADIKIIKIVISVILCDAGEATRSLEIARAIKKYCLDGYKAEIIFLSRGSRFEDRIIDAGFEIYKCDPQLPGIGFVQDFKPTKVNIIGDVELAQEMLAGEMKALTEIKPHYVLYGFNPIASLARRMTDKKISGICFLPLPLCREMLSSSLISDVPDDIKLLTYLPKSMRKKIVQSLPVKLKMKVPILKQGNILKALDNFNWPDNENKVDNLFDMLKSDCTIVTDFKEFYKETSMPESFKVTGPLFSSAQNSSEDIDKEILNLFSFENKKLKVFVSLGSSGRKEYLIEAVKALRKGAEDGILSAVVLSPPAVCPIEEILSYSDNCNDIYITDKFVKADLINAKADIVICHGGQGTIQTAINGETPIIGVAMQMEQQINLEHVVSYGGAIRIPSHRWHAKNIAKAVMKIKNDESYKRNIKLLTKVLKNTDGMKNAAEEIWHFIKLTQDKE